MNSFSWELFRYSLTLKKPLRMLGQEMHERTGMILRLHHENHGNSTANNFGEGEIAPLPGMHPESLSEAEKQIRNYLSGKRSAAGQSPQNLFASVLFGLDMSLRTLFKSRKVSEFHGSEASGRNFKPAKSNISGSIIPVNGLATGSGIALQRECEQLQKDGFKTIKLKVGRLTLQEDIERVQLARKILGNETALRLDANRSWEWDDALIFAEAVKNCKIEYCEEPLRSEGQLSNLQKMEQLYEQTGMPLALDETLWNASTPEQNLPAANVSMSWVRALILKPGILGGWDSTKMWIDHAQKNGVQSVFSSCFESGLGLNWIAFMAGELLSELIPTGLDTSKWFVQDLINPHFSTNQGSYLLPDSWPKANDDLLEQIDDGTWENGILD